MGVKIFHYNPITGKLVGTSNARLSPLDKKIGKDVYLLPKNATFEKPPDVETLENKAKRSLFFDGKKWEWKVDQEISKTVSKKIDVKNLLEEFKEAFPGVSITKETITGALDGNGVLVFSGIEATQENESKIDLLIQSHDPEKSEYDIERMPAVEKLLFKEMIEEMRKVEKSFPTYTELKERIQGMKNKK